LSRLSEREAAFAAVLRGRWGQPIECHEALASSQDRLRELAEAEAPEGACVIAEFQAAGRGQHGRSWIAKPRQSLLFSLLLRPRLSAAELAGLPALVAGLALRRSLAPWELDLSLRWPNDLMAGPRKLAGLLMEGRIEGERYRYLALGVGLNLEQARVDFPPELSETAVSLKQLLGWAPRAEDILAGFLMEIERLWARLEAGEGAALLAEWKRHWRDRRRIVRTRDGSGRAADVDLRGALLLQEAAGERHLIGSGSILSWEGR